MSISVALFAEVGLAAALAESPWSVPSTAEKCTGSTLVQTGSTLHFTPDSEIYVEGDDAKSFYKVVSGVVRTCKFLSDGRRQIDAFYGPGEVFGLEGDTHHRLSAEAVSDCTVLAFRRRGLETMAANDGNLCAHFFSYAMHCLGRAQDHSILLGRASATQKLAAFLLEMADRTPGEEIVDLAMSRQDIADYLGLTIETVSRTLSQLERDGLITLPSARRVALTNRQALRHFNA